MKLTIQSLHFTAEQELSSFVTIKVYALSHYYDKIESAKVFLKLERSNKPDNKICEIRLAIPGNDLFAEKHSETFETATNEAVDALQQQLKKMKII